MPITLYLQRQAAGWILQGICTRHRNGKLSRVQVGFFLGAAFRVVICVSVQDTQYTKTGKGVG